MPSVSSNRGSAPRQDFTTPFPDVPKRPVNNIIGLDKYYRSATYLLRQVLATCLVSDDFVICLSQDAPPRHAMLVQADEYRNKKNDYQLCTMLMRFARCASFVPVQRLAVLATSVAWLIVVSLPAASSWRRYPSMQTLARVAGASTSSSASRR